MHAMNRRLLLILFALAGFATDAIAVPGYSVYVAPSVPRVHRLAVGETATFSFRVTANFGTTGNGRVGGFDWGEAGSLGYEFVGTPAETCGAPIFSLRPAPGGGAPYPIVEFPVTPPLDETPVTCTYRVTRTAASAGDLSFSTCSYDSLFCPLNQFWIGALPDLALRIEQASPPTPYATDGIVRIVASNPGQRDVAYRGLTTDCVEFGGGIFAPAPFAIENDFPGACASDPQAAAACINLTGTNFSSLGYRLSNIPAGGEASCLLRLRPVSFATRYGSIDFRFARDPFVYAGGGPGFDVGTVNDVAPLGLTPVATPVPIPRTALAFVLLGLLLAGAVRLRGMGFGMTDRARAEGDA